MAKTIKDTLVRTTAVRLAISEKIVETIVNHQFTSAIEAMDLNKSVELSGFGKFLFNTKKAQKHIKDLERIIKIHEANLANPDRKRGMHSLTSMLENAKEELKRLKPKVYEH
jgi:nucleoid DNA-binding protein